ncbi:MAG: glutathione S-transferase family protein [Candidatus Omnitrophica bacterium]|jgi:glutathione S-transferase|nr:glutathione S-transferase family protein [Candidatus Omnitrophota bacterium]
MIKLYCFPRSGNSREVKIVLSEKNIPFESLDVRANPAIKEDAEFKKASPNGTVPAIIDGDVYLSEGYDINEYLEDKYPQNPLLPKDAAVRAQIRDWVKRYDKSVCLRIGLLLIEELLKAKENQKEEVKVKLRADIHRGLQELDEQLEKSGEYFFGTYSLADASMTPHLAALHRVSIEIGDETANLKAWMQRMSERPSFEASAR